MKNDCQTGVYICSCPNGDMDAINNPAVISCYECLEEVTIRWNIYDLNLIDSQRLLSDSKDNEINRIILAGNQPGNITPFFSRSALSTGNIPGAIIFANFNKFIFNQENDTKLSITIVTCTLYDVPLTNVITYEDCGMKTPTVVANGDLTGIQVSLKIADFGHKE